MPEPIPPTLFKTRFILLAFLLPVLAFLALGWINRVANHAPNVTFNTITGQKLNLKDLQNQPVLVTFWATDCATCIKEVPELIKLYQQFHPQGLEIIAVAMYYDPPNRVLNLSKALQLPYPVALDLDAELAQAFGRVQFTPNTFLIAPDGSIALNKAGALDLAEVTTLINRYIKG